MINKKMFKRLAKEMLPLHKETLEVFTQWLEKRTKINETLLKRELTLNEYEEFITLCFSSIQFIHKNCSYYEKYKIDYLVFNKYLLADLKFCENQIKIINIIDDKIKSSIKKIKNEK